MRVIWKVFLSLYFAGFIPLQGYGLSTSKILLDMDSMTSYVKLKERKRRILAHLLGTENENVEDDDFKPSRNVAEIVKNTKTPFSSMILDTLLKNNGKEAKTKVLVHNKQNEKGKELKTNLENNICQDEEISKRIKISNQLPSRNSTTETTHLRTTTTTARPKTVKPVVTMKIKKNEEKLNKLLEQIPLLFNVSLAKLDDISAKMSTTTTTTTACPTLSTTTPPSILSSNKKDEKIDKLLEQIPMLINSSMTMFHSLSDKINQINNRNLTFIAKKYNANETTANDSVTAAKRRAVVNSTTTSHQTTTTQISTTTTTTTTTAVPILANSKENDITREDTENPKLNELPYIILNKTDLAEKCDNINCEILKHEATSTVNFKVKNKKDKLSEILKNRKIYLITDPNDSKTRKHYSEDDSENNSEEKEDKDNHRVWVFNDTKHHQNTKQKSEKPSLDLSQLLQIPNIQNLPIDWAKLSEMLAPPQKDKEKIKSQLDVLKSILEKRPWKNLPGPSNTKSEDWRKPADSFRPHSIWDKEPPKDDNYQLWGYNNPQPWKDNVNLPADYNMNQPTPCPPNFNQQNQNYNPCFRTSITLSSSNTPQRSTTPSPEINIKHWGTTVPDDVYNQQRNNPSIKPWVPTVSPQYPSTVYEPIVKITAKKVTTTPSSIDKLNSTLSINIHIHNYKDGLTTIVPTSTNTTTTMNSTISENDNTKDKAENQSNYESYRNMNIFWRYDPRFFSGQAPLNNKTKEKTKNQTNNESFKNMNKFWGYDPRLFSGQVEIPVPLNINGEKVLSPHGSDLPSGEDFENYPIYQPHTWRNIRDIRHFFFNDTDKITPYSVHSLKGPTFTLSNKRPKKLSEIRRFSNKLKQFLNYLTDRSKKFNGTSIEMQEKLQKNMEELYSILNTIENVNKKKNNTANINRDLIEKMDKFMEQMPMLFNSSLMILDKISDKVNQMEGSATTRAPSTTTVATIRMAPTIQKPETPKFAYPISEVQPYSAQNYPFYGNYPQYPIYPTQGYSQLSNRQYQNPGFVTSPDHIKNLPRNNGMPPFGRQFDPKPNLDFFNNNVRSPNFRPHLTLNPVNFNPNPPTVNNFYQNRFPVQRNLYNPTRQFEHPNPDQNINWENQNMNRNPTYQNMRYPSQNRRYNPQSVSQAFLDQNHPNNQYRLPYKEYQSPSWNNPGKYPNSFQTEPTTFSQSLFNQSRQEMTNEQDQQAIEENIKQIKEFLKAHQNEELTPQMVQMLNNNPYVELVPCNKTKEDKNDNNKGELSKAADIVKRYVENEPKVIDRFRDVVHIMGETEDA